MILRKVNRETYKVNNTYLLRRLFYMSN